MRPSHNIMLALFAFLLAAIPRVYFSKSGFSDSFAFIETALADIVVRSGSLLLRPFTTQEASIQTIANGATIRFVPVLHIAASSLITGISPLSLQFIPINGLIVNFLFFAVARRFLMSISLASLGLVLFAWEPVTISLTNNTFVEGYAFIFLLLFLLLYLRLRDNQAERGPRATPFILLIFLCFMFSAFSYHGSEFEIVVFGIFIAIVSRVVVGRRTIMDKTKKPVPVNLFLSFIVFYGLFESAAFAILIRARIGILSSPLATVTTVLLGLFSSNEGQTSSLKSPYGSVVGIAYYVVVVFPVVLAAIIMILSGWRRRELSSRDQVFGALVFVGLIEPLAYSLLGFASTKFLLWVSPMLLVSVVQRTASARKSFAIPGTRRRGTAESSSSGLTRHRLIFVALFLVVVFMLCGARFALFSSVILDKSPQTFQPMMQWVVSRAPGGGTRTFSDLVTSQELLVESSSAGGLDSNFFYVTSNNNLSAVYAGNSSGLQAFLSHLQIDYLVLSKYSVNTAVIGGDWYTGLPLAPYLGTVDGSSRLDKIYDGHEGAVYAVSGNAGTG